MQKLNSHWQKFCLYLSLLGILCSTGLGLDLVRKSAQIQKPLPPKGSPFKKEAAHPLWPSWHFASPSLLTTKLLEYQKNTGMQARLGVAVGSLRFGRLEVGINADSFFTPASTLKTLVTGNALLMFPPQSAPRTLIHLQGMLKGGTLTGRLILEGQGDPNLSRRFFENSLDPFLPFVDSLKSWGIKHLEVECVAVDTFFSGPHYPRSWHKRHAWTTYGAPQSALSFQDNSATITVKPGSSPRSPALVSVDPPVGYIQVVNKALTVRGKKKSITLVRQPGTNNFTISGNIGLRHSGYVKELPVYNPPGYALAALKTALQSAHISLVSQGDVMISPLDQWGSTTLSLFSEPPPPDEEQEENAADSLNASLETAAQDTQDSLDNLADSINASNPTPADSQGSISELDSVVLNSNVSLESPTDTLIPPAPSPKVATIRLKTLPPGNFKKTLSLYTAPIQSIADEVNQRSQNQHAEILLRLLGKQVLQDGSDQGGIKAEKKNMAQLGLDTSLYKIKDGSGLSDSNKITPRAMVEWLGVMARQPRGPIFLNSLVAPGIIVRSRRLAPWGSHFRFKTGYVGTVEGLVGYIFNPTWNDTLVFAVYLNNYSGSHGRGSAWVDSLTYQIYKWYNPPAEAQSFQIARDMLASPQAPTTFHERIDYFSKALINTPYQLGGMGEGRFAQVEAGPLLQLKELDCVTYIEHVLALALSRTTHDVLPLLSNLRYNNKRLTYENRNHFFAQDWLRSNQPIQTPLSLPGEVQESRTTGKKKFFSAKGIDAPDPDPLTPLTYLPSAALLSLAQSWPYSDEVLGIAFVGKLDWLWITHTGFIVARQGQPLLLRHASSKAQKVTEEPLAAYLQKRGSALLGAHLFGWRQPTQP